MEHVILDCTLKELRRTRNIKEGNQKAWSGRTEANKCVYYQVRESIPLFERNWANKKNLVVDKI